MEHLESPEERYRRIDLVTAVRRYTEYKQDTLIEQPTFIRVSVGFYDSDEGKHTEAQIVLTGSRLFQDWFAVQNNPSLRPMSRQQFLDIVGPLKDLLEESVRAAQNDGIDRRILGEQ